MAHVALPESQLASIEIVNIFEPGDGDVLRFTETSFEVGDCLSQRRKKPTWPPTCRPRAWQKANCRWWATSGERTSTPPSSRWTRPPARWCSTPRCFTGVDYHFAKPVADYGASFRERLAGYRTEGVGFSCNCILNFLFGELEGQNIGDLRGPVTFGEIGYQLLNQTLVVLRID